MHIQRAALLILIITVGGNKRISGTVEHIEKPLMQRKPGTEHGSHHHIIIGRTGLRHTQRSLHLLDGVRQLFTHLIRHNLSDTLYVPAEPEAIALYLYIPNLSHILIENRICLGKIYYLHSIWLLFIPQQDDWFILSLIGTLPQCPCSMPSP